MAIKKYWYDLVNGTSVERVVVETCYELPDGKVMCCVFDNLKDCVFRKCRSNLTEVRREDLTDEVADYVMNFVELVYR